jgi:glycosyltransferase involved in cell wall biosynthesis
LIGTFRKTLHLTVGARLAGVPVVSRIGLSTDVPRNAKYRFLFRHLIDRIAVNTGEIRAAYLRMLPRLDPGRVQVMGKGIEPSTRELDVVAERRRTLLEAGIPEDAFVVGALARLAHQKRLDRWLAAVAAMPDDTHGLLVGEGDLRGELEAEVKRLGIAGRVHLMGYQYDPQPWLRAMDVLLLSSKTEALANAMLEALAVGTPVITTPVAGSRDALFESEEDVPPGIILQDFEVPGMVQALTELHDDAARVRAMGEAARTRIARHFTQEAELDRWERLLRKAVNDRL